MSPGMDVSLFDCLSDPVGLVLSCCCSCVVSAFTRSRLDERECTPFDTCAASAYADRQSLRSKYNMGYAPAPDCLSAMCCQACFTMQTAKELALKKGDEPVWFGDVGANIMGDR
ncbi:unnamed protein product [Choristocarpus tenellus]